MEGGIYINSNSRKHKKEKYKNKIYITKCHSKLIRRGLNV